MQLYNTLQEPIMSDKTYTAIYTNSFNSENLTLEDVAMFGKFEDPTKWLSIADEIQAKDYGGYANPWIVVHFGTATILNEDTLTEEQWNGVFLQQKYYMNPALTLSTQYGLSTLADRFGFGFVLAKQTGMEKYMALFKTTFFGYQKMWMPVAAQVTYAGAQRFDYYGENYGARIQSAYSHTPTVAMNCMGNAIVYATSITQGYYYCSSSNTGLSGSSVNFTSAFYPRMCCFIKWNKIEA